MLVRRGYSGLDHSDGIRKELPRPPLERQHLARRYPAQYSLEPIAIGSQEEELAPKALGLLGVIAVILVECEGMVSGNFHTVDLVVRPHG